MSTQGPITDAGGEIAALVYTARDRPDLVLCDCAKHLVESGRRVCGLIQLRDRPPGDARRKLMDLDSWRIVDVARGDDAAGNVRCSVDGDWLYRMARRAEASIRVGVDAVIVNRFGPLELAGRGFRNAIVAASETETPLLIAVPEFEFEHWTRFSNGMTTRLDCALDPVLEWWHRVASPGATKPKRDPRACELFK
ncbi:MAG TPA: DUF2478 domain-containing protein [Xanthobacteraceae bacterium]|jgi:nucleoside-triphosphatase THEP1|nr:DUF2478 domain-containing protein [Xanthobacteraceae bacterium]